MAVVSCFFALRNKGYPTQLATAGASSARRSSLEQTKESFATFPCHHCPKCKLAHEQSLLPRDRFVWHINYRVFFFHLFQLYSGIGALFHLGCNDNIHHFRHNRKSNRHTHKSRPRKHEGVSLLGQVFGDRYEGTMIRHFFKALPFVRVAWHERDNCMGCGFKFCRHSGTGALSSNESSVTLDE